LSQALADARDAREPLFPRIEATPEAFFQRCRDLRPAFFAEVFRRFTARLVDAVPPRYAAEVAPICQPFAAVVILDGSRLAAMAHRLKLLWNDRAVVRPGCLDSLIECHAPLLVLGEPYTLAFEVSGQLLGVKRGSVGENTRLLLDGSRIPIASGRAAGYRWSREPSAIAIDQGEVRPRQRIPPQREHSAKSVKAHPLGGKGLVG